jgi:uncharacterized integral membrane protein
MADMNSMWLKIKIWTKVAIFAVVAVYLFIFYLKNNNRDVEFWYWYNRAPQTPVLLLVTMSFLVGVLVAILVRMMFRTIRQIREMRSKARTERLEREVADMKAKAAMLQTKTGPPAAGPDEVPLA